MILDYINNDMLLKLNKYGFMQKLLEMCDYNHNLYPPVNSYEIINALECSDIVGFVTNSQVCTKLPSFNWTRIKNTTAYPNYILLFVEANDKTIDEVMKFKMKVADIFCIPYQSVIMGVKNNNSLPEDAFNISAVLIKKRIYEFIKLL